ncbi:MAG TPA: tail fiber domain-containing protein, partial [Armatimonadota bacterium]|nr:tail fiber domain-containing protein [Armatimonadota bacterium]
DFSKLLQAEPKTYTRPGNPEQWEIGYIAEDIDALGLKPLVMYDQQGRPDSLNYEKMVLYLAEIAKSQQKEIDALKAQVAALTAGKE